METSVNNKCGAFTSLEQSKKLAEILPLESADMFYMFESINGELHYHPIIITEQTNRKFIIYEHNRGKGVISWSLAALLGVASSYCSRLEITIRTDKKYNVFAVKDDFVFRSFDKHPDGFDNLVDACVTIIEKLHELKIL